MEHIGRNGRDCEPCNCYSQFDKKCSVCLQCGFQQLCSMKKHFMSYNKIKDEEAIPRLATGGYIKLRGGINGSRRSILGC